MKSTKIIFKLVLSTQFLLFGLALTAQNTKFKSSIHKTVQLRTDEIFDSLVKIRRDFHANPEVSGQEKRTSKKIAKYLLSLGLEVKTNIGGNGVVGILKGDNPGKKIAWRADIDAMPSKIPDVVNFPSKNKGVRHICGHDVNTTIALGIANVLASQKETLQGTIYFIFQPSEENIKGAKAMIDDGLFDIISPEEIYALHVTPMPVGLIASKPEWLFSDYKFTKVTFKNSNENESIIEFTKKIISDLHNVKPDSKFWDTRNLLDPNIGLENPNTIFKDYQTVNQNFNIEKSENKLTISTLVSSSNIKRMKAIIPFLNKKIGASKYAKNLLNIENLYKCAPIKNDKKLTTKTMNSISAIYGNENVIPLYGPIPDGRSDDFAYFQEQVPGVYFLLGGSNFEKGIISMPHSPNFAVDEQCIKTGVNFFSSMIIERLIN
ncbi:MAG: amidohydrolase [Cellulophaga sp.]